MSSNQIGTILLAAGESARLGKAKQLLEFRNQTLLRRSVKTALRVSDQVVVTLGARSEMVRAEIKDLPINIVENKDWKIGMGGSVKLGLARLIETNKNLKGVIIMVCDQPLISDELLEKMIAKHRETDAIIVASEYENTRGVPALFSAKLFPELLALESEHGAKYLIKRYREQVVSISFPEGAFDIDTPKDYENLIKKFT